MLIVGGRCESALAYASRVLVALVLVTSTSSAAAQDLEPRAYSNTPIGLNFLIAGYAYNLIQRPPEGLDISGRTVMLCSRTAHPPSARTIYLLLGAP